MNWQSYWCITFLIYALNLNKSKLRRRRRKRHLTKTLKIEEATKKAFTWFVSFLTSIWNSIKHNYNLNTIKIVIFDFPWCCLIVVKTLCSSFLKVHEDSIKLLMQKRKLQHIAHLTIYMSSKRLQNQTVSLGCDW